jgi:hypothetical protein
MKVTKKFYLLSGWWGAGKSYLLSNLKNKKGTTIVDVSSYLFEKAEINQRELLKTQKQKRFDNEQELLKYYALMYQIACVEFNTKHYDTIDSSDVNIFEVPPPFFLWCKPTIPCIWLNTQRKIRIARLRKLYMISEFEASELVNFQYRTMLIAHGNTNHIITISDNTAFEVFNKMIRV